MLIMIAMWKGEEKREKNRERLKGALENGKARLSFFFYQKIPVLEAESHPMMVHLVASGVLSGWDEQMKS